MSSRKGKDPRTKEPLFYDEKKKQVSMQLTPTAIASLDRIATALGISRSELVERIARADEAAIMELARGKEEG